MYWWYEDFVDETLLALDRAGRRRISAASAPARIRKRAPSRKHEETASSAATTRNVRCVPIAGMSTSAGRKVPSSDPAVESAYRRPATAPEVSTLVTARRIANGDTIPRSTTGGAQSSSTARKLPTTAPAEASSSPSTVRSRNGFAGREWLRRTPRSRARSSRGARAAAGGRPAAHRASIRARGRRERCRSGSPIRSSRSRSTARAGVQAVISVASAPIPAPKTSAPRARRFGLPFTASALTG